MTSPFQFIFSMIRLILLFNHLTIRSYPTSIRISSRHSASELLSETSKLHSDSKNPSDSVVEIKLVRKKRKSKKGTEVKGDKKQEGDRKQRRNNSIKYELILRALLHYKFLNSDLVVPQNFIVPNETDEWPDEFWGLNLGHITNNIKSGQSYTGYREELLKIGFVFNVDRYDIVKLSLLKYKELNHNMLVAYSYVIPTSNEWPKETWGLNLGYTVSHIRRGHNYADKREELSNIGFDYDPQMNSYGFDLVKRTLQQYKKLSKKGDLLVPSRFEVPQGHVDWPPEMWGIKLGNLVNNIRQGCYKDKREDLLSIGFVYIVRKKFDYECVKRAIHRYKSLNNGSTKVSSSFKIPIASVEYSEDTWGLCLGNHIKRIREGLLWPDKRSELLESL